MSWWSDLLAWINPPGGGPDVPPVPPPAADPAAELLLLVNEARLAAGRGPLHLDSRLTTAAARHAATMARLHKMAHTGLGDGYAWSRASAAGYQWREIDETIGEGYADAAAVLRGWRLSPPHCVILLGASVDFGAAVARDDQGVPYWCAVYGVPHAEPATPRITQPRPVPDVPARTPARKRAARPQTG